MNVFKDYAGYYDLLYRDKDYAGEVTYINRLLQRYAPNTRTLLELGCGTGRHAMLLAQAGYTIYGVDISAEMLQKAAQNVSQLPEQVASRVEFSQGNIQEIRLNRPFDAVIALFHVINYQITNAGLRKTFATAKAHLKPGGIFLFDFWYGPAVLHEKPGVRVKRLETEGKKIIRIAEPVMHPNQNIVDVNYEMLIEDTMTHQVTTLYETHKMRYLFYPELEYLLEDHEFTIIASFEWMTVAKPLGCESWNGVMIVKLQEP